MKKCYFIIPINTRGLKISLRFDSLKERKEWIDKYQDPSYYNKTIQQYRMVLDRVAINQMEDKDAKVTLATKPKPQNKASHRLSNKVKKAKKSKTTNPICTCGHSKDHHIRHTGTCCFLYKKTKMFCACMVFQKRTK